MPRIAVSGGLVVVCFASTLLAHPDDPKLRDRQPPYQGPGYRRDVYMAGGGGGEGGPGGIGQFARSGVEIMSWVTLSECAAFSGLASIDNGNVAWGYTSPSGREYAILGNSAGTHFVEVTNPGNAQIIGWIDGPDSLWRDIKVYQNYAYAISEGGTGIQVINMSNIDAPGTTNRVTLAGTVNTPGTAATHTVWVNEQSGYLYRCGGGSNGLRIYSLANPANPAFVGQWQDRYVHECLVVNYESGPYAGREIAFVCNGFNGGFDLTGLDILDVTNKSNIVNLYPSRVFWDNAGYSHQIYLSEDRRYAYINDELDETSFGLGTRTIIVDVRFLLGEGPGIPFVAGEFISPNTAIGHNLYTRGNLIFESNYRSGLRILCAVNPLSLVEIGYVDTYPANDSPNFNGNWGNYPYFPSGTVVLGDMERGLFVLDVTAATQTLVITYPQERPATITPLGGDTVQVEIIPTAACGSTSVLPGSAMLMVDGGSGFVAVPMTAQGGNLYQAAFPPTACGQTVHYYVTVQNTNGDTFTDPPTAPTDTYSALSAFGTIVAYADNFENDNGWTTQTLGATAGLWQRGVPVNDPNWAYDPASDADGSGKCWLTGNTAGNSDVDDGATRLISPIMDMSDGGYSVAYDYFLRLTDTAGGVDRLLVEISSNGAAGPWTVIATHVADGGLVWQHHEIDAAALTGLGVAQTAAMQLRFTINDANPQSIVEGGLDAVLISKPDCAVPCPPADGDVNVDLLVDGDDVPVFVNALLTSADPDEVCAGDFNGNGQLDPGDVPGFVSVLLGL